MTSSAPLLTSHARPDGDGVNEDAIAGDDRIAVVVDGAGLPMSYRAGCSHSVAWYSHALADAFAAALADPKLDIRMALANALAAVAASHAEECDLAAGSPSGTVAGLRVLRDTAECLVLCDAGCVVVPRGGEPYEITDDRIVTSMAAYVANDPRPNSRELRREAGKACRNRPGGYWVAESDPRAAEFAVTGNFPVAEIEGLVLVSDGAARGYRDLGAHTVGDFGRRALRGEHEALIGEIRTLEAAESNPLAAQGEKPHDDISIASWVARQERRPHAG
jgi:hypothetical protein